MKKILLISYYYPPLGGIGSQRSQKFARYLPEYGWHPIVLTPESGSYFLDPSLDDGRAAGVEIVRTPAIDLSSSFKRALPERMLDAASADGSGQSNQRPVKTNPAVKVLRQMVRNWVYIPDGQIGWYPYAVRAGRKAMESGDVDAILSTSFPVTAHLIARRLKAIFNKPWIADFRDLWTENHYANYTSSIRKRLDKLMESKLLDNADALVTVSNTWAETLRNLAGNDKRVEVIRNGFDSEDFAGIERKEPYKWTVTYVGNFYGANQDPSAFLQALRRLIESGRIAKEDVRFKIVGERDPYVENLLERFEVADITDFTGFVSHRESLACQINSSLLLLILHGDKSNSGHIPGKLYEYLGSRTSILGIVPPDFEAGQIIRETKSGTVIEATDISGIEKALMESYTAFKSSEEESAQRCDLFSFERKYGVHQLAELLAELTKEKLSLRTETSKSSAAEEKGELIVPR